MELNYFAAIEAVLFASGTPVEINRLAEGLGLAPAAMREQLLAYGEQLDRDGRGIRLLFLDPTLAGQCRQLPPEAFSSPLLGETYRLLLEAAGQGRSPSPAMLEGHFSPEEMGHLTTVLQKPESPAAAERALADYIRVIHESASKRRGGSQEDPLLAAKDKFKEKKGYGGKQNG